MHARNSLTAGMDDMSNRRRPKGKATGWCIEDWKM